MTSSSDRHSRVVRNLLWMACGAVLLLVVCVVFAPEFTVDIRRSLFGRPTGPLPPATPPSDASPAAADQFDDRGPPPFQSPLIRSLGEAVDRGKAVLGDTDDELRDTLETADRLLVEQRRTTREAIRQANRQIRLAGRSPQLVLILAPRASLSIPHVADTSEPRTCHLDEFRMQSLQLTQFATGNPSSYEEFRRLVFYSRAFGDSTDPPTGRGRLSNWLWQSGYETVAMGDCSWIGVASSAESGVDHWIGYRDATAAVEPFPDQIWHNGKAKRVLPTSSDQSPPDAVSVLQAEAVSLLKIDRSRTRPLALLISLPGNWDVTQVDRFFGAVIQTLTATNTENSTLLVFASAGVESSDESPATLLVRWPVRIPPGTRRAESVECADLSPTLAEALDALHGPVGSQGASHWKSWTTTN